MERVLGNDRLSRARQHNRFARDLFIAGTPAGTAITAIEVHLLDDWGDDQ